MINPSFEQEPTEEEVARCVAGVYAALSVIQSAIESDSTTSEISQLFGKNRVFISRAISNESIREAIEDVEGLLQSLREADQTFISKAVAEKAARDALPKPNPLLAHLEELGL